MVLQSVALLALVAYSVAASVVGVRLLLLARRTRQLPELLAGVSYLCAPGIGYGLAVGSVQIPDRAIATPMVLFGQLVLTVGCCGFLFFTVTVFRPHSRWAYAMAALGSAGLTWGGWMSARGYLLFTDPAQVDEYLRAPVSMNVAVLMLGWLWTTLESFRYWRMMRKRMALGLADAIVTNRFLLWALSGLTSVAQFAFMATMLIMGENLARNMTNVAVTSLGGVVNTVLLVLIFLPPAAYLRWLSRTPRGAQLATV